MPEREDREKLFAPPVEAGHETGRLGRDQLPGNSRPWNAVNRQPMLLEMHERRGRIESDLGSRHAIREPAEAVRPWMEDGDARRASLGGGLQIFHPPQELDTTVTKRGAEHAVARKEDRLKITRDQGVGECVADSAGGRQRLVR